MRYWPAFLPRKLLRPAAVLLSFSVPVAVAGFFYQGYLALRYAMLWNTFLAALPLVYACMLAFLYQERGKWYLKLPLWLLWLGFFPNTAYMLTDFIHLNRYGFTYNTADPVKWFGLLYLGAGIVVGCGFGMLSLWMLHGIAARKNRWLGWGLAAGASLLSGAGIWIGRCLRFNTWDLARPWALLQEIARQFDGNTPILWLIFAAMSFGAYLFLHSLLGGEGHA